MNIKSLPKHFDEFQLCLDSIKFRKEKMGGGVSLYLNENITYRARDDLDYFDSELEMIVVEIDKDVFKTNSNVLVGLIYRIPKTQIKVLNYRIADILNTAEKEQKICFVIGDLNMISLRLKSIDRLQFFDIMYSHW